MTKYCTKKWPRQSKTLDITYQILQINGWIKNVFTSQSMNKLKCLPGRKIPVEKIWDWEIFNIFVYKMSDLNKQTQCLLLSTYLLIELSFSFFQWVYLPLWEVHKWCHTLRGKGSKILWRTYTIIFSTCKHDKGEWVKNINKKTWTTRNIILLLS